MARTQRDRLSFAAVLVGGACVVLVAGVLVSVLRSPAVPRPAQARVDHRLVMEIHVPGAPSEPLVWTRSQN